jgi:CrcB protein
MISGMRTAIACVALGGALGSVARYAVGRAVPPAAGLPIATLLVNVTGCLAFGLAAGWLARESDSARLFALTGVLGGYTTFSTFGAESVSLARTSPARAAAYVLASVALGLVAFGAGAWMSGLWRERPS